MSGAWSRPPVGRVVPQAELGALGKNLGENNGESRRVCRLEKHPNWIFKEYPKPVPLVGIKRLDQLIKLPQQMSAADKDLVDGHTSWPASRVIDPQQKTIGVLMPLAPPTYSADRQLPSGRSESRVLEVDVLALTEDRQKASKLPPQSLADRISVCASIAAVAALFERHSLVYLDWSYANIFWSLSDHTAYVIDLDGCSFGPRPQIQTHNWADPQVPLGQQAGNASDRYRVALLIARCLTGLRGTVADTRTGLFALRMRQGGISEIAGVLVRALKDGSAAERPSLNEISAALEAAKGTALRPGPDVPPIPVSTTGGVRTWKSVGAGTRAIPSPKTQAGVPPAPPQPAPRPLQPSGTPQNTAGQINGSPVTTPVPPRRSPQPRPQYPPPARPSAGGGGVYAAVLVAILIIVLLAIVL